MNAKKKILSALAALLTLGVMPTAYSSTVTGQIGVTLTITTACTVENGASSGSTWGTIDFGSYSSLSANIDGQTTNTSGSGLAVTCSEGTPATVYIGSGANDSSTLRTLAPSSGSYKIPYRLYSDSARTTEIPLNDTNGITLTATGVAQSIPVYARILPADQTIISPTAGTYTDTVAATVEW
ncbi:spore coat U domain-containing protein [Brenneria populi]|uniref:Spore coat U domain-containing protein n=1 Tax=Brenneria populi TaxID=1505588 RepID=A0ABU6JT89_9GAMM|nr:spore coat U domain-containing protein [Brenneria populi Li et al. 2015]